MRRATLLLSIVSLLSLAACGKDEDKGTAPAAGGGGGEATVPAQTDPALAELAKFIESKKIDKSDARWKTRLPKPPKATFDPSKKYVWEVVTNKGTMTFEMLPRVAPMHVTSFAYLTLLGYFDGLKFHRVIKGFMAQGGDPLGNGQGGPGYRMDLEIDPSVKHDHAGVVSTANAGPGTDGSQFFLTFGPTASLDGGYTIFATISTGVDVLRALEAAGNPGDGPPLEPLSIVKATIRAE